jgi:DNA-binding MarR family transcriptional regulator
LSTAARVDSTGLVQRRPDPVDRRVRIIEATDQGLRAPAAAREAVAAVEAQLLADLDEPTRELLLTTLRQLSVTPVARIEEGGQDGNACAPA